MSAVSASSSEPAPSGALARLVGPLAVDEFLDAHWERAPLHVGRDRAGHFADLVSVGAIEAALSRGEPSFPDAQLVRAGTPVPVEDYTDGNGRLLARRTAHHHRAGATLVLSQAHRRFGALATLVRDLEHELGWRCQANVYLSPPGGSGFAPHHDTHDVFVLQAAGRKTFRFHTGGVDLPFSDERYDPALSGARELGETIELGPGDTLYIPRGIAHDAVAHADAPSLHVTLGVFPVVLRDVLVEAVRIAAERDVELRRSVPRRAWLAADGRAAPALRDALGPALDGALADEVLALALSRLRDEVAVGSVPEARGLLGGTSPPAALGPDGTLVLDTSVPMRAERLGDALRLRRAGEVLEFTGEAAAAVEALLARGRVAVGELAMAAPERRASLAARLVDAGVCTVSASDRLVPSEPVR